MRRVAAVTALVVGLLWCGAGIALAEAPLRVNEPITDRSGALGTNPSQVQDALDRLSKDSDVRLYVVYVSTFSGRGGQAWADQSAQMSQLGRNDALLAVATDDRAYGISLDDRFPLSDATVTAIENRDLRPRLAAGDYAGAAIAMADGLRTGGPSAGSDGDRAAACPSPRWWAGRRWSAGVPTCWSGAVGAVRRPTSSPAAGAAPDRRLPTRPPARPPPTSPTGPAPRSSRSTTPCRPPSTSSASPGPSSATRRSRDFQAALDSSRNELVQAFALRQRIDDEKPDDASRRDLLGQILALCATADERLDAQAAAFDRLRDLEQNAPQVIADLRPKLGAVTARLPGTTAALDALRARYAASAAGAGRRQRHTGRSAPRRRPDRDRRGRHRAGLGAAPGRRGVGPGGGGGDRAGGHAARRGPAVGRRAGPGREPAGRGEGRGRGGPRRGPSCCPATTSQRRPRGRRRR